MYNCRMAVQQLISTQKINTPLNEIPSVVPILWLTTSQDSPINTAWNSKWPKANMCSAPKLAISKNHWIIDLRMCCIRPQDTNSISNTIISILNYHHIFPYKNFKQTQMAQQCVCAFTFKDKHLNTVWQNVSRTNIHNWSSLSVLKWNSSNVCNDK